MSVRFKCPHCQAIRNLHSRMLGREIRCPQCEQPVTIPSQAEIDAARQERQAEARFAAMAAKLSRVGQLQEPLTAAAKAPVPKITDEEDIDEPLSKRRGLPHDHIDMTPMVDITFLLLIFFMSTANFTLQKSLEVPVQKEQKASTRAVQVASDETQDSVTVQVDEHNAYMVLMPDGTDREASSKQDLLMALEDARAVPGAEPPEKLIIEAHRDCTHKAVVAALDAVRDKEFVKFHVTVVDDLD
jgi:biopolymer transport protein ExbD